LTPGAIKDVIAEIRSLTSKPFAMNLWVSMEDEGARTSDENAFNRSLAPLAVHIAALGAPRPEYKPYPWIRFEDQARVLLDEKVPVFSFIYGIPPQEILEECRAKHIVTIATATTPEEGAALQEAGVDAIVASGFEAGGHRSSFLRAAEDSLTGTFSLVPQIADVVNVPVIAAGGIADARGVIAALALGAEAVQMGTVFLSCEESGASLLHRQVLRGKTFLSRKWAKELDYRLIKELWAFAGSRISVRFAYEWHDVSDHWYRSYGNENWEFSDDGLMASRFASINDIPILGSERKYHWVLGRRPHDHLGLSDLGL
jgi:NAD(P)H-dependent flavin oxidoreductase YrpB (nitropropane dioxygenase family)